MLFPKDKVRAGGTPAPASLRLALPGARSHAHGKSGAGPVFCRPRFAGESTSSAGAETPSVGGPTGQTSRPTRFAGSPARQTGRQTRQVCAPASPVGVHTVRGRPPTEWGYAPTEWGHSPTEFACESAELVGIPARLVGHPARIPPAAVSAADRCVARALGSARVSRAGFGVSPKRTLTFVRSSREVGANSLACFQPLRAHPRTKINSPILPKTKFVRARRVRSPGPPRAPIFVPPTRS